jgi:3-methyladenine DNA glycosylase/8-oxoguanine DNA glycosylase
MAELMAIPGTGPWTVEGVPIIALKHDDFVLPGAPQRCLGHQHDHLPAQQEILAIAEEWRLYHSLATSYLFSVAFDLV